MVSIRLNTQKIFEVLVDPFRAFDGPPVEVLKEAAAAASHSTPGHCFQCAIPLPTLLFSLTVKST